MIRPLQILVILALLAPSLSVAPAVYAAPPANDAFDRTWARTDAPVASGAAVRTWMWGPEAFTEGTDEPYQESPGLVRTVQYFDKSRMELTDPMAPDDRLWYVTNGLLASELISGRMQIGDNVFVQLDPALVNAAGDPDDATGPTYATFGSLLDQEPAEVGSLYTQRLDRNANVITDPDLADRGVAAGHYDEVTDHTIAAPFWEFMNATGLVLEGGELVQGPLVVDVNYITGRPVSEAYWSWVKVDGSYKDVLIQCFERRCLTYTPDNEPAWQIEAGNVGLHYHAWRYSSGQQYAVEAIVAAEGGTVTVGDASLAIPAGALSGDTLASLSIHSQTPDAPQDFVPVSPLYDVGVAGMALEAAVTLTLPFNADAIPADLTNDDLLVGRWDAAAGAWDLRAGTVDSVSSTINVTTGELSFWQVFSPQSGDIELPQPPPPPPPPGPNPPELPPPAGPIENLPPEAGDLAIEVDEDSSVDFTLPASDSDGDPLSYTVLTQPEHGTLSGTAPDLTYTPDANYNGPDSFTYRVNDGEVDSNIATVSIAVRPVNDPPVASDQTITVPEDGSIDITLTATDIDGDDLTYTIVGQPQFGTLSGAPPNVAYTPGLDYQGSDSFTFVANDGSANSNIATVTLTVINVNDAPTFTPGADVAVVEDSGAYSQSWAADISAGSADEAGQTTFFESSVTSGAELFSAQPAIAADGTLTFTPAADAFGTATVDVVLKDDGGGSDTSAAHTLTIEILPQNDVPSFAAGSDVSVLEDSGVYSQLWATGISAGPANEAGQTVSFEVVSNSNSALFSVAPAVDSGGALMFTPASNANGNAEIAVRIVDSGGTDNGGVDTSETQTFTITVTSVNDAPTFNLLNGYNTLEDAGQRVVPGAASAVSPGPADESGQTLAFEVTGNTNEALFSAQPSFSADGTLTLTAAPQAFGEATLTVVLRDNGGVESGGQDTSVAKTIVIRVLPKNNAPSFSKGPDVTVSEDSGAYSAAWATNILAGPSNESSQELTFEVTGNTNAALFSSGPAVDATGVLTFTPALNANGSATVTIRLLDDGGTSNGGVNTSPTQSFTITVTPVNDTPIFVPGADRVVLEDSGAYTTLNWATGIQPGPATAADEVGQTLTFIVTNDNNGLFSVQPGINAGNGSLTYQLAPNAFGVATVTVALEDDGGTTNGGVDTSVPVTFTITVTPVNDAPSFDLPADPDQSVVNTTGAQSVSGFATSISSGPNESGQTLTFNVSNDDNDLFSAQPAISSDGTLTYTPAEDAEGTAIVTVVLSDDGGTDNGGVDTSSTQTFTIEVLPPNVAPVANDLPVSMNEDGSSLITLTATDVDGDSLTFAIVSQPASGFLVTTEEPVTCDALTPRTCTWPVRYTPLTDFTGSASFTFQVNDGQSVNNLSNVATVSITVNPVNDPPAIENRDYTAQSNMTLSISGTTQGGGLLAGVTDPDANDPGFTPQFTVSVVGGTSPAGGTVSVSSNGDFIFEPPAGVTGDVTFTYQVCDDGTPLPAACTNGTATVDVQGPVIWFVNPTATTNGTGTLASPFNNLASAAAVDAANQRIFLYSGTATNGSIILNTNEWLIGQGETGTTFDALFGITPAQGTASRPSLAGARPVVQGQVTLASDGSLRGLNVTPLAGMGGVSATGAIRLVVSEVSVSTTNATAVNLQNSDGSFVFTSVSADGGTNGIVWSNTSAATGSLTVSGSGATPGSGGTIQSLTSDGIRLSNVGNVTLSRMTVQNNLGNGIYGSNVTNVSITGTSVLSNADDAAIDEAGIKFANLLGTSSITGTTVAGSVEDNVQIINSSGVLNLTVSGSTIRDTSAGAPGNNGLLIQADGTATINADVDQNQFLRNRARGVKAATNGSASMDINITDNTLQNSVNDGVQIEVVHNSSGTLTFDVDGNDLTTTATGAASPININLGFSGATMSGTVSNNSIDNNESLTGPGIRTVTNGSGTLTIEIANNVITRVANYGIHILARDGSSNVNATVTGNTVTLTQPGALQGIRIDSGAVSTDSTTICAQVGGSAALQNTVNVPSGIDAILVRNRFAGTTFNIEGYLGAGSDTTAVATYIASLNTFPDGDPVGATVNGNEFGTAANCTTP